MSSYVLGIFAAVRSYRLRISNQFAFLSWERPNNSEPDITYCVDVINSSLPLTLYSECGITGIAYIYPERIDNVGPCDHIAFVVIPVNQVGNGTESREYLATVDCKFRVPHSYIIMKEAVTFSCQLWQIS